MDQQWQPYSDNSMNRPGRFSHGLQATPLQPGREFSGPPQQHQPPAGYIYETYQSPSNASNTTHTLSMASSPSATPHARDYMSDGDVPMEDADPYNRMKYPSRPNHQNRASAQYLSHEESSAARRYSPMNMLSPPNPYNSSPKQPQQNSYSYTSQAPNPRQSPTRTNHFSSPSQPYQPSPCRSNSPCHF